MTTKQIFQTQDKFTHPEVQDDEVFFSNMSYADFESMEYESKRQGVNAYDGEGHLLNLQDWKPVFVSREDIVASGRTLSELRREWWKY